MAQHRLDYQPLLQLKTIEDFRSPHERDVQGDRRDGKLYRYTDTIRLYVNVAVATGRPLLLLGPTGCGKSSLAFNLARRLRRRYYEYVVTSRSEARDLFYRFDAVRRLVDAHANAPSSRSYHAYIEPGPLWWILDPAGAARRGRDVVTDNADERAHDPAIYVPSGVRDPAAVLLIDEIDKAEPDFPNNLLVPLGSRQFSIDELSTTVELREDEEMTPERVPLVLITSNRERELPEAFVRRCIVLEIKPPTVDDLVELGTAALGRGRETQLRTIAETISEMRGPERLSTAEFLDAVRAIDRLQAKDAALAHIVASTTWRPQDLDT
jgi:MoxR-like ATPase